MGPDQDGGIRSKKWENSAKSRMVGMSVFIIIVMKLIRTYIIFIIIVMKLIRT